MKKELIAIYMLAAELLEDGINFYPAAAINTAIKRLCPTYLASSVAQNIYIYWRDGGATSMFTMSTDEHVLFILMLASMTELDIC